MGRKAAGPPQGFPTPPGGGDRSRSPGGPLVQLDSPRAAADWLRSRLGPGARLTTDSRRLRTGDAFVAWPGYATDGRRFVASALHDGASACIVEAEDVAAFSFDDARVAALAGLKSATGSIADIWFDAPSQALEVVATTGTNGKTSTAWWMAQALSLLGRRCGVIGTLGVGEPPSQQDPDAKVVPTGLTTPDPVTLHASLREFVDRGFAACAIEASSIGVVEHRLDGVRIAVALFTNFTRDHLDYHGDMAAYWAAKAELFAWPRLRAAVLNLDDPKGEELAAQLQGGSVDVITYSIERPATLTARAVGHAAGGLRFEVHQGEQVAQVETTLIGGYNVSNLLAVIGGLKALGVPLADAAAVCAGLSPVPGRMQLVGSEDARTDLPLAVVDYAHTPDALEKALLALQPVVRARRGRLWCVFGCGGNRDASKRPLMGGIAARLADRTVVTSDNPRDEDPAAILAQIARGLDGEEGVELIEDRRAAIVHALTQAEAADVVLIAGKGHEDYQEVRGEKRHFSDRGGSRLRLALAEGPRMMTLAQAHALLPGSTLVGDGHARILRVHSDTRTLQAGDLFVALKGERFDAHDFLPQARASGAVAAIAQQGLAEAGLDGLLVADTRVALGELAANWRRCFQLPLIAVTGSNGKTTVTQMIASILRAWLADSAFSTQGNLNNDIGVPLTLLRLRQDDAAWHRAGVVELGMNHPGEIALLARLAAPTVALVNNAQREHQEFMVSVEAVARENGSVFDRLSPTGVAVFPSDDAFTPLWHLLAGARPVLTFAERGQADVTGRGRVGRRLLVDDDPHPCGQRDRGLAHRRASTTSRTPWRRRPARWPQACRWRPSSRGLEAFEPVKGRSQVKGYERAAAARHPGRRHLQRQSRLGPRRDRRAGRPAQPAWLVLGDMGEVGDQGPAFHEEVGRLRQGARHRTSVDGRHARRPCRIGARLGAALLEHGRAGGGPGRGASCDQRAGQGIAIHEDGTGRRGADGRLEPKGHNNNSRPQAVGAKEPRC